MIASVIIWIYILIFSYIYGWAIIDLLCRLFRKELEFSTISIPLVMLLGLAEITVLASFLSLFIKLGWLGQTLFLILGLFLGWLTWKRHPIRKPIDLRAVSKITLILFLLVFFAALEYGTHTTSNPDTGIYHAQAIRWIETYPAVPGLGNLHTRLAYDSNWLVVNAFFSFSFLGLRSFHVLPGAFLVIVLVYLLEGTDRLLKGKITITDILKTLLIPLIFYTLRIQISSPGTDFPVQIFIGVIICIWLESGEIKKDPAIRPDKPPIKIEELLIYIFSITLVTIKLTAAPILLLALFVFIKRLRKYPIDALKLSFLALLILGPWFARNLILSGYWIFPVPFLANLSPNWDWKIPVNIVIHEAKSIQAWARIPGEDSNHVLAMPFLRWIKVWFEVLTINQKLFFLSALFSPFLFGLSLLTILRKNNFFKYYSYVYLVVYFGLLFWLYEAPDIRFGYSFIGPAVLLGGLPLLVWLLDRTRFRKYHVLGLVVCICLYQASVLINGIDYKTLQSRLVLPADYTSLATVPCSIHGYSLFCAEYYNICGYDPFPCIPPGPGTVNKTSERRGPSLADGFRPVDGP